MASVWHVLRAKDQVCSVAMCLTWHRPGWCIVAYSSISELVECGHNALHQQQLLNSPWPRPPFLC
jgi:hypothetical protein